MDSHEVGVLLEECLRAAEAASLQCKQPTEAERIDFCSCTDSLCAELASLLQEATDMKWPFVPEKWQYKQSVSANDKTNLSDLISKHLPELLAVLKASIVAQEASTALAVVFLVDRFLYWTDDSSRLLKITKLLHRRHRDAPVAPQLVIRQARVYLNSGKLQKAEYILSSLITNSGATGCWVYHSESDKALVQAVSVQVRGVILQKLGLWLEAAELIWASLVGFYALPQPDKKGIGTSLGILANILLSMNDEDFTAFRTNPHIELSLLGDDSHRLLSAAQAAKRAVIYSQYNSFYVLTGVAIQGTCLLSYSFSVACPDSQRQSFLMKAREAFAIGLLSKSEGELVTSKQELHTFLKTAYSLTVAHKWLGTPREVVAQATQTCQKGLAIFYDYCHADTEARDSLCAEIMNLVAQVKLLLQVEPFLNSDKGSFIPDSYRNIEGTSVNFTLEGFFKVMQRFHKYHASLCKTSNSKCKGTGDEIDGAKLCITALGTTIGTLNTECTTETSKVSADTPKHSDSSVVHPPHKPDLCTTIDTLDTVEDWIDDIASVAQIPSAAETTPQSLSQLNLSSSSISLTDSFSSQSSWEKISADLKSPTNGKHQPTSLSVEGPGKSSKSPESDGSFFLLDTVDSETSDSLHDPIYKNHTPGGEGPSSGPHPQEGLNVHPKMDTEIDSVSTKPDAKNVVVTPQPKFSHCASTETTDSSFEMLEDNSSGRCSEAPSTEKVNVPQRKNPSCYSCLKHNTLASAVPKAQYSLSRQDYQALLAGVCNECLLKRLHSNKTQFKLKEHRTAYSALHLKFSKATGLWTARETCVYIGKPMGVEGKQRAAIWVQFLHQEERLSSYVGKDYLKPKQIQFHLKDVERQMTAQYYVTEFNKSLYDKEVMAQIFYIPSEALLILNGDDIAGCVTVEPFMLGDFVKLTNNTGKKDKSFQATEYGLAFGHFTYLYSCCQEVVVDLQGWVTANGKGLTYLTDPQIHSIKTPRGPSNFAARGLRYFLEEQHGPECNSICQLLKLPPVVKQPHVPRY
ncbi:alpha-protein kinase 1 isoform X4 [Anabas testudineus]|uniref:alpha-protein kinase 1 isoform X4 n=1 Tax=Anabas testudineus TaxID=64144 RepID=UPI000E457920|nr:alpha-protein kinase 1 isoform X4 [Anabas testudineus]